MSAAYKSALLQKIGRVFSSFLPVAKERSGYCNNCGACCHFSFRCPFLKTIENGKEICSIYIIRPPSCRKFPRTINQHNQVKAVCSFSFNREVKSVSLASVEQSIYFRNERISEDTEGSKLSGKVTV